MAEIAVAKKQSPVLMPDRIGLADDKRHDWVVDLPMSVTLEQAMEPSYWAHVAAQMDPLDHIELRAEDGSWVAYLIVSFCERNYATVVLDRQIKLGDDREVPLSTIKHRVDWKGPQMRWCVVRVSDSALLHQGEREKGAAYQWLQDHEKTLQR